MEVALLFTVLFILMFLGVPIFLSMLLATITTLAVGGLGVATLIPSQMIAGIDSYALLAIPFFILMGNLMNAAGLTSRLVDLLMYFIGGLRAGLAYAVVGATAFIATVSGSGPATASMVGSTVIPMMSKAGYRKDFAGALVASAAVLGPVFPPSVPMVFIAVVTTLSAGKLFVAGVLPGVLLVIALLVVVLLNANPAKGMVPPPLKKEEYRRYSFRTVLLRGAPSLLTPLIILAAVIGGFATITEISMLASAYVLILAVAYRSIDLKSLVAAFKTSALFSAAIMMIFAAVGGFTYIVAISRLGDQIRAWIDSAGMGVFGFLTLSMLFFLLLGATIDAIPAILIFVPVLLPVAESLGVHPIHYAAVVVINLMIGLILPPVAETVFVISKLANLGYGALARRTMPFLGAYLVVLILITYIPFFTTWLPEILF